MMKSAMKSTMTSTITSWRFAAACAFFCGLNVMAGETTVQPVSIGELNERTFDAWRSQIEPTRAECAFERIPWLTTFGQGVMEADRQQRPLLVWVMNGHPLGCT